MAKPTESRRTVLPNFQRLAGSGRSLVPCAGRAFAPGMHTPKCCFCVDLIWFMGFPVRASPVCGSPIEYHETGSADAPTRRAFHLGHLPYNHVVTWNPVYMLSECGGPGWKTRNRAKLIHCRPRLIQRLCYLFGN